MKEELDTIVINENAVSIEVLEKQESEISPNVNSATETDEVNIIACMLAKNLKCQLLWPELETLNIQLIVLNRTY